MTSRLEFDSRAMLCKQLAMREPGSQVLWLAEAEKWSRLSQEQSNAVVARRGEVPGYCHWGILRNRGRPCLRGRGGNSQSRTSAGIARKDLFEDFLDLMAIEDSE
jgi:hypothetical protein